MSSIAAIQLSIDGMSSILRQKREELERLQQARRELIANQADFKNNERLTSRPELTANAWHGNHANQFKEIQTEGIAPDYKELYNKQLQEAITDIEVAIARLEAEIQALLDSIASANTSLSVMKAN